MQKIGRSIPVRGDDKSKASGAKNNRVCLGEPPPPQFIPGGQNKIKVFEVGGLGGGYRKKYKFQLLP